MHHHASIAVPSPFSYVWYPRMDLLNSQRNPDALRGRGALGGANAQFRRSPQRWVTTVPAMADSAGLAQQ